MTLLAPLALFGILLLALPIIVHLFKPRKMRQTPFSSLRWLKQTHQRLSRRIQWHQWLLFLLRAGVIVLLVFALTRPLLGLRGEGRPVDRFVIVDTSRSMAYQTEGVASPLEKAQGLAAELLSNHRPGDRAALVLAGKEPRLVTGPVADALTHVPTVKAVKASLSDGGLASALPLIRSLIPQGQEGRDIELVFLTDNLKQRWQPGAIQAFLKDLPAGATATVVDVGAGSPQNAWIANARLLSFGPDEDHLLRVDIGCMGEGVLRRDIRLSGIEGLKDETLEVNLKPSQFVRVDFPIAKEVKLAGQTAEVRLEGADALPSDDVFFLSLDVPWSLRVLVVEPESLSADGRKVGLNLVRGMGSLKKKTSLKVETRASAEATAVDFQNADVIFLAGVPELSAGALESLENRVRAGAGLVLFLGPHVKPDFYNQKLYRQSGSGLLPLPLKTAPDLLVQSGSPGTLTSIRWKHPLLAPLYDPVLNDLTQARFHQYCVLQGPAAKDDQVLARLDDETPAIIERSFGAGRVLLFNTTANTDWSDLPLKKVFVPLLDRLLSYLHAGGAPAGFTAGDNVVLTLPALEKDEQLTVLAPSGAKLTPRLVELRARTFLHLDEVSEAGIYRVQRNGKSASNLAFAVNAGRTDSPLGVMDAKVLEQWWSPASLEVLSADVAAQRFAVESSHWALWPALVLVAGLLLLAETIYVYRLCPRVNPKVAESVVPQGSIMKPLGEKATT